MSGYRKCYFEKEEINKTPHINQEKKELTITGHVECKHEVAGKFKQAYETAEIEYYSAPDGMGMASFKFTLNYKYLFKNLKLVKIDDPIIFDNTITATFSYDEMQGVSIPFCTTDDYSI